MSDIRIIYRDCDPTKAEDKTLPTSAFLIEYVVDGVTKYDITVCNKQVDMFDYYWDRYKSNLKSFTQAAGNVKPKLWNPPKETSA